MSVIFFQAQMYKGHDQAEILHSWDIFQTQKLTPSKMLVEKYPRLEERGRGHPVSGLERG